MVPGNSSDAGEAGAVASSSPMTRAERPGLLADAGIVLAGLGARHPLAFAGGIAVLLFAALQFRVGALLSLSRSMLSSVQVIAGLTTFGAGLTLALRVPWCPRAGLRGAGAWCASGAAVAGLLVVARTRGVFPDLWWDAAPAVSGAIVLLVSASYARAARDRVSPGDGERAAHRLVAAVQQNPWPVAVVCAWCPEPATEILRRVAGGRALGYDLTSAPAPIHAVAAPLAFAAATMVAHTRVASFATLAAAIAVARLAALATLAVTTSGIDTRALGWISPVAAADLVLSLVIAAVAVLCCALPRGIRSVTLRCVGALVAVCSLDGIAVDERFRFGAFLATGGSPAGWDGGELLAAGGRQSAVGAGVMLALFCVAASTVRPRTVFAAGAAVGVAAACVARALSGQEPQFGPEVITSALQGVALGGWALLIRWVRSATVVPDHHPLVRDWRHADDG